MSKNIIKTIFITMMIVSFSINFTGCKKKEYTIDTPYDFNQGTSDKTDAPENTGDTSQPTATANASAGQNTNPENKNDYDNNQGSGEEDKNSASSSNSSAGSSTANSSGNNSGSNSSSESGNTGSSNTQGSTPENTGTTGPSFIEVAEDYTIPKDIEDKMTTKALLDTYMSYPFLDIICFEESPENSYKEWINSDISCGKELLARKDIVPVALDYYKQLLATEPTTHISSESEIDLELKIDWIELLLTQNEVKNKASASEKAEILKQAQLRDSNVEKNGYAITDMLPDLAAIYK